jgi:hypothetical protein
MQTMQNPFERLTGADRIQSFPAMILLVLLLGLSGLIAAQMGLIAGIGLIAVPFIFFYLYLLFSYPIVGFYSVIVAGFLLLGVGRYVKGIQVGLALDGILILTFIALIFRKFYERVDWSPANKDITYLSMIWFGYALFQIVNPEAQSMGAWFSGRGISIYMLMIVPLTLILINSNRKIEIFFFVWGILSLLATFKGIMQKQIGVDPWEQAWLNEGNASTHVLFGKLRVFSFLSDAGQFGANQGYTGVVFAIISLSEKNLRKRLFFVTVAVFGFYGLVISGTRGALSVPFAGLALFFLLRKNVTVLATGFLLMAALFVFFKFTYIGQGNPEIRRMRSAFDPNDASLQVRLENQRKFRAYLATRPFGGGIGHAGGKARRFLPNAFLSNTPTDSWYVLIWAEQGVVGLTLHLFILFYILIKASFKIMFRIRDPMVKLRLSALASGMFGIMAASYGNMVLGQMPTSVLIYSSMALILNSEVYDNEAIQNENKPA